MNLLMLLTNNCNLKCSHCLRSSGPGLSDTTVLIEDYKKMIDNLPKFKIPTSEEIERNNNPFRSDPQNYLEENINLTLTGGEVFTIPKTLEKCLRYLEVENKQRSLDNQIPIKVGIQTNGFWAQSDERIRETLQRLREYGVDRLQITSKDNYHFEQGIDRKNIDRLFQIASENEFFEKNVVYKGVENEKKLLPIGRGKEISDTYDNSILPACESKLGLTDTTIFPDGRISNCCGGVFFYDGNLIENTLVEIHDQTIKNPNHPITLLRESYNIENGIENVLEKDGLLDEKMKTMLVEKGNCWTCAHVYGE